VINDNPYDKGYYLADGIYPSWPIFVKTARGTAYEKCKRFAKEQEAARKDVERAFDLPQSRWAIVRYPPRIRTTKRMWNVMTDSVIMHNIIIGAKHDDIIYDQGWDFLVDPELGVTSW
jgi:hypothetical protein